MMTMTKKSTAVVITLAVLTLAGFIVVSNLFTGAKQKDRPQSNSLTAQPQATAKPQATASPPSAPNRVGSPEAQLRTDLAQAQSLLDQLNTDVLTGDWGNAQNHYAEFDRKTQLLPAPQLNHPDISPMMQDFFALYKVQLERALGEQNAQQSRFTINQLFGIVSEQRARFGTRGVPLEFQRLHFLIREIEIWNHAGDRQMLGVRALALRDAWKEVRPVVVARRNGVEQARNFDALVEKLSAFDQTQDLSPLISELGKEFEQMNSLFQHAHRQSGTNASGGKIAEDND